MDILVFLFGVWFNPMTITYMTEHTDAGVQHCVIFFAGGGKIVADTDCKDAAYDINRAYR